MYICSEQGGTVPRFTLYTDVVQAERERGEYVMDFN